ncbi:MAG: membrane-bound lytic murein transglycosylase D [Saprospiraceae bacterium]|jgi:membrane-bound lytic murein transglycosylase D
MSACSTTPKEPTVTPQSSEQTAPTKVTPASNSESSNAKVVTKTIATPVVVKPAIQQPKDLWQRLREGFALPELDTKRVAYYERQFTAKPAFIENIFTRASWFLPSIVDAVQDKGYPMEIALLPAVESAFKPDAKSHSGASGLWQFIGSTSRIYDMHENWWYDARRDPDLSTAAAIQFLGELNVRFDGDWFLSFAGYNAGGGNIEKAIRRNKRNNQPTHFSALKLRKETAHYVPKLVAFRNIIRDPAKYNITLPKMPTSPAIAAFDAGSQIDLSIFASSLGVDQKVMRFLNRAYKHGVTPPDGPHIIQLPVAKLAIAKQELNSLGDSNKMQWAHYRVQSGDVLGRISSQYNVSVAAIKRTNKLSSNLIHLGQILLIPVIGDKGSTKVAKTSTANSTQTGDLSTEKVTHLVRKGDTLWQIARRYGVKVAQLSSWNKISSSQTLRLGQRLLIYPRSS